MGPGGGVPAALLVPLFLLLASSLPPTVLCADNRTSSTPAGVAPLADRPPPSTAVVASGSANHDTSPTRSQPPFEDAVTAASQEQAWQEVVRNGTQQRQPGGPSSTLDSGGNATGGRQSAPPAAPPLPEPSRSSTTSSPLGEADRAAAPPTALSPSSSSSSSGGGKVEEPPRKVLLVGYLSNVAGTDNFRRQGLVVSGAMTYAVYEVNTRGMIPGYKLDMLYHDTRGEMLQGTRAVIESWKKGAVAFFGPEDSCYVEASVASSLNVPMISYKCSDTAADKIENSTFARTVPSAALVVRSVIALLRFYNWRKFSIVHEHSTGYATVARSLEKEAEKHGFHINSKDVFHSSLKCCENKQPCCHTVMPKILDETYRKTRIYVYMGNYRDLQTMLIAMRMRGLTDKAEYQVITINHDIHSWEEFNMNFFGKVKKEDFRALSDACGQLMVILPRAPGGEFYASFTDKVREYNEKEPFNFPLGPTTFKKVRRAPAALFKGVMKTKYKFAFLKKTASSR